MKSTDNINIIKKLAFILIILLFHYGTFAQEKGSYLNINGGIGLSGFDYRLSGILQDGENKLNLGGNAKVGYSYYFDRHWGVSSGIGIAYLRSKGSFPGAFSNDNFFNLGDQIDDDTESGNIQEYILRVRLSNWEEEQKAYMLEIPLMLSFQHKFGEKQRHGFYMGVGAKFQIPVTSSYKVLDGNSNNDLRLNVSGHYVKKDVDVGLPGGPGVPQHGFGSLYNPYEKLNWGGDLNIKFGISAAAEAGFLFGLSKRVDLTVGGFIDYGLNDIKKEGNKPYMEAPLAYIPGANNNIGAGIKYNGMINSDRTPKVKTMAFGGSIGIRIKIGKTAPRPTAPTEPIRIEPLVDTVKIIREVTDSASIMRADSLERSMKEMQKQLEALAKKPEEISTTLQGIVLDAKTKSPLIATIEISDPGNNEILMTDVSDNSGKFRFTLTPGKSYVVNVSREGYMFKSEKLTAPPGSGTSQVINLVTNLDRLEVNRAIVLEDVFFDTNKATLKPESIIVVYRVCKLMLDNPSIVVEISGHTDNVGSAALNKKLSLDRATTVVNILLQKGISPDRLQVKGYGFERPVAPNNTPEGRAMNRRTEFKIIKQ